MELVNHADAPHLMRLAATWNSGAKRLVDLSTRTSHFIGEAWLHEAHGIYATPILTAANLTSHTLLATMVAYHKMENMRRKMRSV